MVVRHRDLKEIVDAIKENFDKAASAGDQVSQMLHLGRAQLDHSFSQLKTNPRFLSSSSVLVTCGFEVKWHGFSLKPTTKMVKLLVKSRQTDFCEKQRFDDSSSSSSSSSSLPSYSLQNGRIRTLLLWLMVGHRLLLLMDTCRHYLQFKNGKVKESHGAQSVCQGA
ncbi:unnamed protein product [Arabidopsis halleri]